MAYRLVKIKVGNLYIWMPFENWKNILNIAALFLIMIMNSAPRDTLEGYTLVICIL